MTISHRSDECVQRLNRAIIISEIAIERQTKALETETDPFTIDTLNSGIEEQTKNIGYCRANIKGWDSVVKMTFPEYPL